MRAALSWPSSAIRCARAVRDRKAGDDPSFLASVWNGAAVHLHASRFKLCEHGARRGVARIERGEARHRNWVAEFGHGGCVGIGRVSLAANQRREHPDIGPAERPNGGNGEIDPSSEHVLDELSVGTIGDMYEFDAGCSQTHELDGRYGGNPQRAPSQALGLCSRASDQVVEVRDGRCPADDDRECALENLADGRKRIHAIRQLWIDVRLNGQGALG